MNYIDYIKHAIYLPSTYYRRFDFDLPEMGDKAKRAALASLPFVALYKPAGTVLSIGMNGARSVSHIQNAFAREEDKDWAGAALEAGKAALAATALVTTIHNFASALLLTTGVDALQSGFTSCELIWNGEYSKAGEEALQTMASAAYLAFMATGALEAMVVFALLQAIVSLYQARKEIAEGRLIEGAAKMAMAGIRLNQAKGYIEQIQRRNAYMEMERIRSLFSRIVSGRQAGHLIHHPLSSLRQRIADNEVVLTDGQGNEISFGSHFHGNGQELVKGENIAFRTKIVNGEEVTELDFKVNHAFRARIDEALNELKKIKPKELQDILSLAGSHATGITIKQGSFGISTFPSFFGGSFDEATEIQIDGLGKILIGSSPHSPNCYDRVVVQLKGARSLFDLHEVLSIVDLDKAIRLSTSEDFDRLKMGHLFRTFCPREATPFERTPEFFTMPLDQLKAKIIEKAPEMKGIFDTYFNRMREEHLFDGRVRYRIEGLADAAYEKGARALTAAVTGAYDDKTLYERVASMLRLGMLSTEVRDANAFGNHGLGGFGTDYRSGGADSVYTQLLTEKNCREKMEFDELYYDSKVRILIGLEALEMGTYQYHSDSFGNRILGEGSWWSGEYGKRDGILEFIANEQSSPHLNPGHEVMLKERVAPKFFKGLIVPNEKTKMGLVKHLQECGLIENGKILNTDVDKFIHVGDRVSEELFA